MSRCTAPHGLLHKAALWLMALWLYGLMGSVAARVGAQAGFATVLAARIRCPGRLCHGVSGQGRCPGRLYYGVSGQGRCPGRRLGLGLGFGFVLAFRLNREGLGLAFRVEKQNIGSSRNRNLVGAVYSN